MVEMGFVPAGSLLRSSCRRIGIVSSKQLCSRTSALWGSRATLSSPVAVDTEQVGAGRVRMISSNDFRVGTTIELDGAVHKVLEFLHVKPGKGSAFVRTKLKNLGTGNTVEKTFRAGESVQQAMLEKEVMQFTYLDGEEYVFMNMETFEEERLAQKAIGDQSKFIKEGLDVEVLKYQGKVLDVDMPKTLVLTVAQTDPGVKGNTVQGGTKPATLETGATVQVPLFIKQGEKIKVDVQEGKYLSRAKDE